MLQIETELKAVERKGIGLFTKEYLPIGKVWHVDETEFDKVYTREFIEQKGLLKYFYHYATWDKETDTFYLCSDNARFVNHSEEPNTFYDKEKGHCIAIKPIQKGEEITCDYRNICDDSKYNGLDFDVW
jgi:uncharacterized protein